MIDISSLLFLQTQTKPIYIIALYTPPYFNRCPLQLAFTQCSECNYLIPRHSSRIEASSGS